MHCGPQTLVSYSGFKFEYNIYVSKLRFLVFDPLSVLIPAAIRPGCGVFLCVKFKLHYKYIKNDFNLKQISVTPKGTSK